MQYLQNPAYSKRCIVQTAKKFKVNAKSLIEITYPEISLD